jgi:hypothetical protein
MLVSPRLVSTDGVRAASFENPYNVRRTNRTQPDAMVAAPVFSALTLNRNLTAPKR